jgi:hypothetical protein
MGPGDVAFIRAVIAFVLLAGTGLTAFWIWLRAKARAIPDFDRTLDALRDENAQLNADVSARIAELEERVDFAERRLTQPREPARLPEPRRPRTPV